MPGSPLLALRLDSDQVRGPLGGGGVDGKEESQKFFFFFFFILKCMSDTPLCMVKVMFDRYRCSVRILCFDSCFQQFLDV